MAEVLRDPLYSSERPLLSPESFDPAALQSEVAVTGGTGFVGSHLIDTLHAAGIKPRILVRNPARARWISGETERVVPGSMEDTASLEHLVDGVGLVFHLAGALRAPSEAEFIKGNAGGTGRLIEAIQRKNPNARLVYCSSQAALGPSEDPEGLGTEAEPHPISSYGRSKAAAETLVRRSDLSWSIVRPPAIFGPRDRDVFEFFKMAERGFVLWPAGERLLSVACVDDVLRSLLAIACQWTPGRIHHVVPYAPIRMEDLLRLIGQGSGRPCRYLGIPPGLLQVAGWGGSALRLLGLRNIPLSRDKVREILAKHWVLKSEAISPEIPGGRSLAENIALSWDWYRQISRLRPRKS